MSETQGKVKWCGPELGQHNDEIYRDMLKLDDDKIKDYIEKGII
jgi:formyl-CoA transferase